MSESSTPIRCKRCNVQLASRDPDGLCIRRGDLEITVTGKDYIVVLRCYRCSAVNVLTAAAASEQRPVRRPGAAPT